MLYQLHRLLTALVVMASPVRLVAAIPAAIPAQVQAQSAQTAVPYQITLDTTQPTAVVVKTAPKPDFDTEVLLPLKTAQAAAAAEAAKRAAEAATAAAAAKAQVKASVQAPAGDDAFAQLRFCEAGGDYTRNSGNGYFGAYQYNLGSWGNYGGYARPDLAPASVQDEKARADQARRGWSPWPACSRKLGLM